MLTEAVLAIAFLAPVQDCYQPTEGFGAWGVAWGPNAGEVRASAVFDDGRGPELYVGGVFEFAGETLARSIARFDGTSWEALPGPGGASVISPTGVGVRSMAVYDDGGGPALYVGADFAPASGLPDGIAKWDGASWTSVVALTSPVVGFVGAADMCVWDDGGGAALYFAGTFNKVNGVPAASVAKLDASGPAPLGGGYAGSFAASLAVFDDGSGEQLCVGGLGSGGQAVQRWDGSSWSFLPGGFNAPVEAIHVHDDGSGSALYAGGTFSTPFQSLVRWSGGSWSMVGTGVQFFPTAMATHDDGTGEQLYAIGRSYLTPPPGWEIRAARWDGAVWEYLQAGLSEDAYTLCEFDDGTGDVLLAGGQFTLAGGERADHCAKWTAGGWSPISTSQGLFGEAVALYAFDDGGGAALHAAPVVSPSEVLRWTGSAWDPLPGEFTGDTLTGGIRAFAGFDSGSGPELYAGGAFTQVDGASIEGLARFDGAAWHEVGGGLTGGVFPAQVWAACVHDFGAGPRLVVGGIFAGAGGIGAANVAVWDGASWSALGSGIGGDVYALASFDDGSGAKVYAGGDFATAGGAPAMNVARWNGSAWEALGSGVDDLVWELAVGDIGPGPLLYAGGDFTLAGGVSAPHIATFDGTTWSAPTHGGLALDDSVHAIAVHDEGEGPELYAGGWFTQAGGVPAQYVARWDGSFWEALDQEPEWAVLGLASFDEGLGLGPVLFAVGLFGEWGGAGESLPSMCIARVGPEAPCPPVPYCTAKVNSQGCTPAMYATGSTSLAVNTLRLRASNVLNNKSGLLFWSHSPNGTPFQGGFMCCQPPVKRTPIQPSGGNPPPDDCSGAFAFHWNNAYVNALGLSVGDWYYCQYWSRDPGVPSTTNLTDALRFLLTP